MKCDKNKSNDMFCINTRIRLSQIILPAIFFFSLSAAAQTRGTVTVVKDPRIDSLLALRLALSKMPNTGAINAPGVGNGFRVQFFNTPNRTEAYDAQAKFNQLYPDIKTYVIYSAPNFKVKAGDYRTRPEANALMQQLRGQFTALFIINEKINLPKPDSQ